MHLDIHVLIVNKQQKWADASIKMQGNENKAIFMNEGRVIQVARELYFATNSHGCLFTTQVGISMFKDSIHFFKILNRCNAFIFQ